MSELINIDKQYVANTYNRFPVEISHGEGSVLYSLDGKRYIDMGTGIAVNTFGVCDKAWQSAVISQLQKVQHTSNLYYTEPCARLAKLICEKTQMKKVFFSNSGAEANECAIKVARKYASEKKGAEYCNILTLENSFHGRTITTLAATGQEHYHELFQPLTKGFIHTPANDIEALEKAVSENKIAGILFECVQGEGGVLTLEENFVRAAFDICQKHDIVLMVDEVQTGNGRSGSLYAYMNYGIKPDVVTTAKGIGGGLPLGCAILGEKVENTLGFGDHGSTFGGNPVACAGALSILERIDESLLSDVRKKSELIFGKLSEADGVISVSGMGLMIGVETKKPASEILKKCMAGGVLCLTAKTKLRLLPALNIPYELLNEALDVIVAACKE